MRPLLDFHRQFPGIELTVVDRPVSALREAVLQGQVDFVLLYAPLPEKQFRSVPLLKERVLLAVPGDSPLAQPFGGTQPVPYPQISFPSASVAGGQKVHRAAAGGFRLK